MKTLRNSIIAMLALFAVSCTDDTEDLVKVVAGDAPVLTAPEEGNVYVLLQDNKDVLAERFVWTAAAFGADVVPNYDIEIDFEANNFSAPQVVGTTAGTTQIAINNAILNTAVNKLGAVPEEAGTFQVRVKAYVGSQVLYSNAVEMLITPYKDFVPVTTLYLVGSVQAYYGTDAWTAATALEMRYIGDGKTQLFEAYVKIAAADELKFIDALNFDAGNYGTVGTAQDGNLQNSSASGNLKPAATDGDGFYYIKVDLDAMTYKAVKMNWGIIGAATPGGWDGETAMTYDFASNKYAIDVTLKADEMKFRSKNTGDAIAADQWAFQIGDSTPKVAYNNGAGNLKAAGGATTVTLAIDIKGNATVTGL